MTKFANNASDAIWWSNLQLMQVVPSKGHFCNYCNWRHLVANISTHASGAICWPNLKLMQVVPSEGRFCNYCRWRHLVNNFATNASGAKFLAGELKSQYPGSVVPLAMFFSKLEICQELKSLFQALWTKITLNITNVNMAHNLWILFHLWQDSNWQFLGDKF